MGLFERPNDGKDFMAIPPNGSGETTEEEGSVAEKRAQEIEVLSREITEIEADNNHKRRGELDKLRNRLRKLEEPFQ